MQFRKILTLRGPNLWANFPVLEAWVELGALNEACSNEMPGFNDRLKNWLPSLIEHRCSVGERGGFFTRLERGTYLTHILEHVSIELQCLAGTEVGYGRARATEEDGVYRCVVEYEEEAVGKACLEAGHALIMAAVEGRDFDIQGKLVELRALANRVRLGPSTRAIVKAARERQVSVIRVGENNLVQLGYGSRQRKIWTAETDRTSAIAESLAKDKQLTRLFLQNAGVPVPEGRPVSSAEDAWDAAREISGPVVVKPQFGNQGRGVATNLTTREQVAQAYAAAMLEDDSVVVESFATGDDYRLLVIGDRLVAAARREPAHVIGNGLHTVRDLVEIENRNPQRSDDHATALSLIKLDPVALQVLAEQGLSVDSVPVEGQRVLIRRNANLSTGGTAADVTDRVHPEVAARAVEATKAIGLDIAGIDIIAMDISVPLEMQGGMIVEVNAGPGLRMHLQPCSGQPQPVGQAVIEMLFPQGDTGRIPVIAVTGVNGKTTTTRVISHIFRSLGRTVGMTNTEGVYVNGRRIESGDCSGPQSARKILMNPNVEVAVLETARGGILRAGLGFDRADVAVVTNIGEGDHLGVGGIENLEMLAKVKRVIVDVVPKQGMAVLNAADPHTVAMASHCMGSIVFFAVEPENEVIVAHRQAGGKAIYVRKGIIVLAEGEVEIPLAALTNVPLTHGGRIRFQIENVLAAAAAAWAQGVPRDAIRSALESFSPRMDQLPGRFNVFSIRGATVVVDYGHNASALVAILEALSNFPATRRRAVFSMAGDRRDADMVQCGRLLGDAFDEVLLYEDHYTRGRPAGQIIERLREGLAGGQKVKKIDDVQGAINSVRQALDTLQPEELLLIQADEIDETVSWLREYQATQSSACELVLPSVTPAPEMPPASTAPQNGDHSSKPAAQPSLATSPRQG